MSILINEDKLLVKLNFIYQIIRPSYLSFTSWSILSDSLPCRIGKPFLLQPFHSVAVDIFHYYWMNQLLVAPTTSLFGLLIMCVTKCINKKKSSVLTVTAHKRETSLAKCLLHHFNGHSSPIVLMKTRGVHVVKIRYFFFQTRIFGILCI